MSDLTKKRLLYLDVFRGFVGLFIILSHSFSHIILWDYNLIPLEDFPIWMVIVLSPLIAFSTCGAVFAIISSTALGFKMQSIVKRNLDQKPQKIQKAINKGLYASSVSFALLFIFSIFHVSLLHYGLHWNGTIQRTVITGSLEVGHFIWTDVQVLFQTDAIALIAMNGLISVAALSLLWRNKGYLKVKRNLIILVISGILWFVASKFLHQWFDGLFFEALNQKQYLTVLLLKFIIGPPNSTFPSAAYGFFGLIFGITFAQGWKKRFFRIIGWLVGPLIMLGAGLYMLLFGSNFSPDLLGSFVPFEIEVFDVGYILLVQAIFIETWEFRKPKNPKKMIKRTKVLSRFGVITLTMYVFESIICVLTLKWYMPLWEIIPPFPADRFIQMYLFVGIQVAFWWILSKYWEKINYKFSLEWMLIKMRAAITRYHSNRLNVKENEKQYHQVAETKEFGQQPPETKIENI